MIFVVVVVVKKSGINHVQKRQFHAILCVYQNNPRPGILNVATTDTWINSLSLGLFWEL